jgi:hypothetical protein
MEKSCLVDFARHQDHYNPKMFFVRRTTDILISLTWLHH